MMMRPIIINSSSSFRIAANSAITRNNNNTFPAATVAGSPRFFGSDNANQKAYDEFMSSLSPARKKFHAIIHQYRNENFTQCTNTRFFKHIISAVDTNNDNVISREEYQTLLKNIGAEEQMSDEDLDAIFDELGVGDDKEIPVEKLKKAWEPLMNVVIPPSSK